MKCFICWALCALNFHKWPRRFELEWVAPTITIAVQKCERCPARHYSDPDHIHPDLLIGGGVG